MAATNRINVLLEPEWIARKNAVIEYGESQRIFALAIKDVIELIENDRKVKYTIEERKLILGGDQRHVKPIG